MARGATQSMYMGFDGRARRGPHCPGSKPGDGVVRPEEAGKNEYAYPRKPASRAPNRGEHALSVFIWSCAIIPCGCVGCSKFGFVTRGCRRPHYA